MSKGRKIFIVVLTIIFIWCLIGAFFFPPAIPVVIAIYILTLFFSGKNETKISFIRKAGKMARDVVDVGGVVGEEAGKTSAAIVVNATKVVSATVGEVYDRMGGEEGARKAADVLGKLTEAVLKIGVNITIAAGKAIVEVTRYTKERIEQEKMEKLDASERDLLDTFVEYKILDDD